ncbi:hypothetical protein [Streptomyces sp. NPDC001340]
MAEDLDALRKDGAFDDVDDALSKIDGVLHTQAETMQRLSEPDDDTPSPAPSKEATQPSWSTGFIAREPSSTCEPATRT